LQIEKKPIELEIARIYWSNKTNKSILTNVITELSDLQARNDTNPGTEGSDASVNVWAASGAWKSPGVDGDESVTSDNWSSTVTKAHAKGKKIVRFV
jgi:hypothetical protein